MSRPHYRGYFLYRQVFDGHFDQLGRRRCMYRTRTQLRGNAMLCKFRRYVDELRRYSVYFESRHSGRRCREREGSR